MSDRNRYCSSGPPAGILTGPNCACGTRRNCACPPGTGPYSDVQPNSATPLPCSRTCVVSHWAYRPRVHIQQRPQEMLNGMTTPVTGSQVGDVSADFGDHAHGLVPE